MKPENHYANQSQIIISLCLTLTWLMIFVIVTCKDRLLPQLHPTLNQLSKQLMIIRLKLAAFGGVQIHKSFQKPLNLNLATALRLVIV